MKENSMSINLILKIISSRLEINLLFCSKNHDMKNLGQYCYNHSPSHPLKPANNNIVNNYSKLKEKPSFVYVFIRLSLVDILKSCFFSH